MNINVGSFKCPKCGNKDLFSFKKWTSADKFQSDAITKKWIFYSEPENEFYCGICTGGSLSFQGIYNSLTCSNDRYECNYYIRKIVIIRIIFGFILGTIVFVLFIILLALFYGLIFFWIDIIYFCCFHKKEMKIYDPNIKTNILLLDYNFKEIKNIFEIWKENEGYTETQYNSKMKSFICKECKKESNTFITFLDFDNMDTRKNTDNSISGIDLNPNSNIKENYISLHIINPMGVNQAYTCNKKETFSDAIKKFYDEYSEYKQKKCFFIVNGKVVEKENTLEENGIKDGDKIQLQTLDE